MREGIYITIGKPTDLVLVGQLFCSFSSSEAVAENPAIAGAAIFTGYALSGGASLLAFAARVAHLQRPLAFSVFDIGYVTTVDIFTGLYNPLPLRSHFDITSCSYILNPVMANAYYIVTWEFYEAKMVHVRSCGMSFWNEISFRVIVNFKANAKEEGK